MYENKSESMTAGMTKNEKRSYLLGELKITERLKEFAEDGITMLKRELEELEKEL